jgi:repressor LexA
LTYFDKEVFRQRLKQLIVDTGSTAADLAEYLHMHESTVSRYIAGITEPKLPTIEKMAVKFNVNPLWLLGQPGQDKYLNQPEQPKKIPVLGTIAAGIPIMAQENFEGFECISEDERVDFALKVKGDSMIGARILDGDIVYIHRQPIVENGEIAAVLIGDEATLKRFYKLNGSILLRSENPNIPDKTYTKKEQKEITILGKAISFKSEVR